MESLNMSIRLNKEKSIGKVLYIVEGGKTEPYLLHRIFCKLLGYQIEMKLRDKGYKKYNKKENPTSQVFVINAEESNIKFIKKDNKFLDNLFKELIENYDFDIDNAAIYYLFDRDNLSNTDAKVIEELMSVLVNSRDNNDFERQGMLLLSYPSIEAFTLSGFVVDSFSYKVKTGNELKQYLNSRNINHQKLSEETIIRAGEELHKAIDTMSVERLDLDAFGKCNKEIFDYQEHEYGQSGLYHAFSLLCVSLLDLGILEVVCSEEV